MWRRRRGKAASRLHVRIVAMFSLVAAIPAIMVAVIASITLDIGLDRWFEIRTKTIINSSLSIADAYVQENARNLQGTTLSMAYDLDRARSLYNLDRTGFRDFMSQEAVARGLAHAALINSGRLGHHDRPDPRRFRDAAAQAGMAGRRRQDGGPRRAGADRAANGATSSAPSSSCEDIPDTYLYTMPTGRPRGDQGAPDRHRQHRTSIAGSKATAARRRSPSRCSISA